MDPIFAAIEAHCVAYMRKMQTGRIRAHLADDAPEHAAACAVDDRAHEEERVVHFNLVGVQPTTMAGVFALLHYVDDFCTGAINLLEDPRNWTSSAEFLWPLEGDDKSRFDGEPLELPFLFWLMRNVRHALEAIAEQRLA